ncbi:thioesterase domain-containing protein [Streptomyces sp. NPDC001691]|uniref:thioesterase domain-containing protein n=1 Tax=Streptomyces sp. NPDC001691 TaxID=3364600 RepID=UPI003682C98B
MFGGSADHPREQLDAWQQHTTADVTVRQFPGGHFYLREEPEPVLRALESALREVRRADLPHPSAGDGTGGGGAGWATVPA